MAVSLDVKDIVKHLANGKLSELCLVCLSQLKEDSFESIFTLICNENTDYCVAEALEAVCQIKIEVGENHFVCIECFKSALEAYKFHLKAKQSMEIITHYTEELLNIIAHVDTTTTTSNYVCIPISEYIPEKFMFLKNLNLDGIGNNTEIVENVEDETINPMTSEEKKMRKNRNPLKKCKTLIENTEEYENHIESGEDFNLDSIGNNTEIIENLEDEDETINPMISDKSDDGMMVIINKKQIKKKQNPMDYLSCSQCPVKYQNVVKLKKHMKTSHDIDAFFCKKCKILIENKEEYENHIKSHKKFKCIICNMVYKRHASFVAHMQKHKVMRTLRQKGLEITCEVCGEIFEDEVSLQIHMSRKHEQYTCHYCGKLYRNEQALDKHIKRHDRASKKKTEIKDVQENANPEGVNNRGKRPICSECGKDFVNKRALQWHLRLHNDERPFTCDVCGRGFVSQSRCNQHVISSHTLPSKRCPLCPAVFHLRSMVSEHIKKMHLTNHKRYNPNTRTVKPQKVLWRTETVPIQELSVEIQNDVLELQARNHQEQLQNNTIELEARDHKNEVQNNTIELGARDHKNEVQNNTIELGARDHMDYTKCKTLIENKEEYENRRESHEDIKIDSIGNNTEIIENLEGEDETINPMVSDESDDGMMVTRNKKQMRKKRKPMVYLSCSQCCVKYRFVAKLKQHMKTSHDIDVFYCKKCKILIENKEEYENHIKSHKYFKYETVTIENLEGEDGTINPMISNESDDGMMMTINKNRIRKKWNLMAYMSCTQCPAKYRNVGSFKKHMKTSHDMVVFCCKKCKTFIEDKEEYENHIKSHKNFKCEICNTTCKRDSSFVAHMQTHKVMKIVQQKRVEITCEVCGAIFEDKASLHRHMSRKHVEQCTCYYCGKLYTSKQAFDKHIKRHERASKKKTEIKDEQENANPEGVNNRDKRPICSECGKDFVDRRALEWHQRLHNNERPYICDVCGRGFVSQNRRNQHAICSHTQPSKRCPLCPALFHLRSSVNTHIKKVHLTAHKRNNRTSRTVKRQKVLWQTETVPIQELSVEIQNDILELQVRNQQEQLQNNTIESEASDHEDESQNSIMELDARGHEDESQNNTIELETSDHMDESQNIIELEAMDHQDYQERTMESESEDSNLESGLHSYVIKKTKS